VTESTISNAASTSSRSPSGLTGRAAPFMRRSRPSRPPHRQRPRSTSARSSAPGATRIPAAPPQAPPNASRRRREPRRSRICRRPSDAAPAPPTPRPRHRHHRRRRPPSSRSADAGRGCRARPTATPGSASRKC
jgi:hypothetical protein